MDAVIVYWGRWCVYAGMFFFLSAHRTRRATASFLLEGCSDKVLHAVEYAGLGGLCYQAFRWGVSGQAASRALLFAIVTASLYGMTDEVHQLFVPFRESSWQDWLADTIGAVIGAMSWRFLRSK